MAVKCAGHNNETADANGSNNMSIAVTAAAAAAAGDVSSDDWQRRMRELQSAIILASLFEVVLGMTGVVGLLLRYIGPMTIAPVITMVALPVVSVASDYCQHNWLIAFLYVACQFITSRDLIPKDTSVSTNTQNFRSHDQVQYNYKPSCRARN